MCILAVKDNFEDAAAPDDARAPIARPREHLNHEPAGHLPAKSAS